MQTQNFVSFRCWHPDRIGQVINKEAASVSKAAFLATHTPMNKLLYEKEPYAITDTSEEGLLGELQRCNSEDRHAFVVVQGIPGTGKSHLIRWIAERYEVEEGYQARVLFIERAQSSLSGTLDQIIKSGIFDDKDMRKHLDALKNATAALSRNALAQTILDQLRIATTEVQHPVMEKWMAKENRLEKFLLDATVRAELLKPGGPIDRLVRFLSQNSGTGIRSDEMPTFEARDFEFKASTLYEIEKGYREAQALAERLQGEDREEDREKLARYLNQLIQYAIGHATSLTNDDLKQLFNDLRRHLRQQNRHLALFIEDVTAFTGLDLGLIDVLATQHTGVSNQEFCRLTSVIGITDNYYFDHFPDNLKDRVTHRITLNARSEVRSDAEILTDENATADMSARYLNAMRVQQEELDVWYTNGRKPEHLPNACDTCTFKSVCHAAFGFENVNVGQGHALHIGLYPFNKRAIWNLYQHLDTSNSKRTPRSLLNNVLYYMLQSHGQKINNGIFPPPVSELGSGFTIFSLKNPLQRRLIEDQGKQDAKRIESLILVWGNGTIDAVKDEEQNIVGGLSQDVFKAFNLRFIAGELKQPIPTANSTGTHTSKSTSPSINTPTRYSPTSVTNTVTETIPSTTSYDIYERQTRNAQQNKYVDEVSSWLSGGKLPYEEYSGPLASLIRSYIDWELHGVSSLLVDDLLKGRRRIYIEGQTGKVNSAYYISFSRSSELANVLLALMMLKENDLSTPPDVLSSHLANVSLWLHQQEAAIVQFVRQPNHESVNTLPFTKLLTLNCLLLTCLQGKLSTTHKSTQQLFLQLVSVSVSMKDTSWQERMNTLQPLHSAEWLGLMKRLSTQNIENQYQNLLRVLNCAQGDSSDVRFVDAATALTILSEFSQNDWKLPTSGLIGTSSITYWDEALTIYETLRKYFVEVLHADCARIQTVLQKFDTMIGPSSLEEVFQSINDFVEVMTNSKRGTNFVKNESLNPTGLASILAQLRNIVREQHIAQLALRLSGATRLLGIANDYLTYFEAFAEEVYKQQEVTKKRVFELKGKIGMAELSERTQVETAYQELEQLLLRVKGDAK